jgi:tryptophanyl-tRNA synthetase
VPFSREIEETTMGTVLSGIRPTGELHLGHWVGALRNWTTLQEEQHNCFFCIVDWHALAGGGYQKIADKKSPTIKSRIREMAIGFLAAGVDPARATLFVQSHVKEHAELHLLLSMITPTPWLLRNPAIKEQARDLGLIADDSEITKIDYGYLGYPVLQAADILLYQADFVPVGEDQLPHLELTREIARRFNHLFGQTFKEPAHRLTETPRLLGLDNRKMSKSLDNAIFLFDEPNVVEKKVKRMITDAQKIRLGDPGHPDICTVFSYHKIWNKEEVPAIEEGCKSGALPCGTCKLNLASHLNEALTPLRMKRKEIEADPQRVDLILEEGAEKARATASKTLAKAKAVAGL